MHVLTHQRHMHTYTYQFDTSWVLAPSKSVDFRFHRQDHILQDLNENYITSMYSYNINSNQEQLKDKLFNGCIVLFFVKMAVVDTSTNLMIEFDKISEAITRMVTASAFNFFSFFFLEVLIMY